MRVTKTVREYIEEQVRVKFPQTEVEKQAQVNSELVCKANEEIRNRIAKASAEIVLAVGAEFGITEDMAHNKAYDPYPRYEYTDFNSPIAKKANTAREERKRSAEKAVKDIIVTLELGGTKADLEKMLAEI